MIFNLSVSDMCDCSPDTEKACVHAQINGGVHVHLYISIIPVA